MRESQIHDALTAWLKKNRIFFIHSTFGKRATMTKDAPDFIILHCNRALLIECKTEKGPLTAGQKETFARLQAESGMVVQIVRSVEQAVSAVQTWLGVERLSGEPPANAIEPSREHVRADLFIGNIAGKDYVLAGSSEPGQLATRVRIATAADLINIRRR